MRYRALDANGDYSFGRGQNNFLVNSPAAVAQAVQTALLLFQGEWFLDSSVGMPWLTQVVGTGTQGLYDQAIKNVVLQVQGVNAIISYSSSLNTAKRHLSVTMTISTIFGQAQLTPVTIPAGGGYGVGGFGAQGYGQ